MAIVSEIFSLMLLFLIIGTIIVIIFDNGDSAKKIAWILVITICLSSDSCCTLR